MNEMNETFKCYVTLGFEPSALLQHSNALCYFFFFAENEEICILNYTLLHLTRKSYREASEEEYPNVRFEHAKAFLQRQRNFSFS